MASKSWEAVVAAKIASLSQTPNEWKISPDILSQLTSDATANVIDAPAECQVLSTEEISITEKYSATELLQMISQQKLSSKDVTTAFCKRAAVAHQLVSISSGEGPESV